MDRIIIYPDETPLDTDILSSEKNTMTALGMALQAILGGSTWTDGLACTPTGPASLQVLVAQGSIYSVANIDGTAYGSLGSDTTHQIVKQGIVLGNTTFTITVPSTTGQSINYLIQAEYQDVDGGSTVLPYYNASNPAVAFNGPANLGTSQNTVRQGKCVLSLKAGASATTGTQVTPTPDAGFTGLWIVTAANGVTTITSGNIAPYSGSTSATGAAAAWSGPRMLEKLNDKISIATGDLRYQPIGGGIGRTRLTGNTNFYISPASASPAGNDSNAGTVGAPWLTLQHALNVISANVDLAGFNATLLVADGTYTAGATVNGPFTGMGSVIIQGVSGVTANCIFAPSSGGVLALLNGATLTIAGGIKLSTTTGDTLGVYGGRLSITGDVDFGASGHYQIGLNTGGVVTISHAYHISGNATAHWGATAGSNTVVVSGQTITFTGTPTFSEAFASVTQTTAIRADGMTFTSGGLVVGKQYIVSDNSVIFSNGVLSPGTYFPGTVNGTTATGGQIS